MDTYWLIKKTGHEKFPYRVLIMKGKETLLDLLAQDKWPGVKGNIFCMRAYGGEEERAGEEEVERVPVLNYSAYGKRLTIILDRPSRKRCSFLFLTKSYKSKEGEYEQIFWQTQQGLAGRKSKYKLAYNRSQSLKVFIDTSERYPWKFPAAEEVREHLPIGDYAIKDDYGFLSIVERKTFPNLMAEFGNLKKFHQHLAELDACRHSALVVEAAYGDFLDKDKIKPYTGNFAAKAIAEIQAEHPNLTVVFCGSRKNAIAWTLHYFLAVKAAGRSGAPGLVRDSAAKYGAPGRTVYAEDEARRTILSKMPKEFTTRQARDNLPGLSAVAVRRILDKLENEDILANEKQGRDIIWIKL